MKFLKLFMLFFLSNASLNQAFQTIRLMGNVDISYKNRGNETEFIVTTPFGNGISASNAWIGIGFNDYSNVMVFL